MYNDVADLSVLGPLVADLRPDVPDSDPELRKLMIGRAAKLERLGRGAPPIPIFKFLGDGSMANGFATISLGVT